MSDSPGASSPDPVAAPQAYQEFLLAALGGDDPAAVQAGTPAAMRHLVAESGPHLRTRPRPAEWSALEALGHMLDAEVVSSARYRFIVAHEKPPLIGYDQDLWVGRLRHNDDDASVLLGHFEAMRLANVRMWRTSPCSK